MSQTTKRALAASLKKLLEEKPLEKITIKDITEDCEVNRQTFYYHYKDVYDLIEWIFVTEGMKALGDYKTYDSWQEGFLRIFYYVLENKRLVLSTFHSIGREQLERFLYAEVYKLLIDVVNEQAVDKNVTEVNKSFIADFYKYAFVGVMFQWIRTGMKDDPKIIVNKISQLISGDIHKALLKYEES